MSYLASAHDPPDLSQEVRRLFEDLARQRPERRPFVSGECSPTLDVLETEHAVEIVADVPGIPADGLRVLVKNSVVLIVGEKDRAEPSRTPTSYHLVERDFGRFARAVRIQRRWTRRGRGPRWRTASCAWCCRSSSSVAAARSWCRSKQAGSEPALHRRYRRPSRPRNRQARRARRWPAATAPTW